MEAHAPLPERQHFERMSEIIERLVEQNVAQATAENHAEHAEEKHVVDVARMPPCQQILSCAILAENDEQDEADQIHQPVPAYGQRSDVEGDRIELRVNQHR